MPYTYICLPKHEWNRLKTQADPPQRSGKEVNKCIKDLIEKSQKWIKSWPDTYEGQVNLLQNRKKEDHKQEPALIDMLRKQQQHSDTKQAIAKARQLIFEGSSYGKQLLSALLASKVIEEREAQIAFKKEIETKEDFEKKNYHEEPYFCKTDQEEQNQQRKQKSILIASDNKSMYEKLNAELKKVKAKEVRWEREDAQLMQELLNWEKQEEEKAKKCQEEQIIKYVKEQQEFREAKLKREAENDAKIEKAKKEYNRKLMKIKHTHKQIINKPRSDAIAKNYEIIEAIENEKRRRFEEFEDERDKISEEEAKKKEQEGITKQHREREAKNLLSKQYKIAVEAASLPRHRNNTCDRQCLIVKSHSERCGRNQKKLPAQYQSGAKPSNKKLQFLAPQRKLIEELRQREKVPSPWTGASGAHAQFADEAGRVLSECKHKTMARRVVDEYRRLNGLDPTSFLVENY